MNFLNIELTTFSLEMQTATHLMAYKSWVLGQNTGIGPNIDTSIDIGTPLVSTLLVQVRYELHTV